ncbi:MAG: DUF2520 domain-containing protein [Ilumatobacteraceae bacterium]
MAATHGRLAVVGAGRVGRTITRLLPRAAGPFGRGFDGHGFDAILLAVPDSAIGDAARAIEPGPLVGHCSGALGLDAVSPHEAFAVHPLMTITERTGSLAGAGAAVAGSTARALAVATGLAADLGMRAFAIADDDRAAYHAAASIASNFLVTLEDAAERLMATAGPDRSALAPLVRAAVDNWVADGAAALTGPIARGDHATVARQRDAIARRLPELLPMFDEMRALTEALSRRSTP